MTALTPDRDRTTSAAEQGSVTEDGRAAEQGYALAMLALLLLPLLAIAAIGVDLGVWYLQAQQNQRIADAASLAAVVWLPDEAEATAVAYEAAGRNGIEPGVDSSVYVSTLGRDRIKVRVATKSHLGFSQLFFDEFAITRSAIAEYNGPLALGSPLNTIGEPSLWLAVSGDCSIRENGDLRSARWTGGYPGGFYPPSPCTGTPNPDFTGEYIYAVTIDEKPVAPVVLEVFDATYSPESGIGTDLAFTPSTAFDTRFELFDIDGAPFDIDSHTKIADVVVGDRDATYENQWRTVATIPDPEPGTYYLRVQSQGGGTASTGSNGFGLRAYSGFAYSLCSTLTSAAEYDPTCPQVSAVEDLSLYASLSGGSSTFYLAAIGGENAGKSMQISLFDVGEGAEQIEILDPDGNPVAFDWTTDCSVGYPATGGCSGSGMALDVSGDGNQVDPNTLSLSRYNDRTVVATIPLPNDYATAYSGRWWQIRYTFGSDITDRTTWSVRMIGDPVRLAG